MAATAALLVAGLSLPSFAGGEAQAASTTLFDVPHGGVLSTLVGAAVSALGTWAAMRGRPARQRQSTRIEGQPVRVEVEPGSPSDPLCRAKHDAVDGRFKDNTRDHDNIFPRLAGVESRLSRLEGTIDEIRNEYKSIDAKLTVLLGRQ